MQQLSTLKGALLITGLALLIGCDRNDGGGSSRHPPTSGPDPLYADQWHLKNTGQGGGIAGEDANVEPVWNAGFKGTSVRIAIVDDGLEITHQDLDDNVVAGGSHNYLDGTSDPTGGDHGTSVAGVAAARDLNGVGGRGAAPGARLVGYNFLADSDAVNEADAMIRDRIANSISSNSWAPSVGLGTLDASPQTWIDAIDTGLAEGRNSRGLIYVFAAGNGAPRDNANYNGYANYRGVIAVCAVGDDGVKASYSNQGANLWVCAPSVGRGNHGISTTDRSGSLGYNDGASTDYPDPRYTNTFGGTSSSTPLVSGVVALMLEANPNLGWRDVRLILAETARKNDTADPDWTLNGASTPYNINHNYGFGVVNADAAVTRALTWTNVGAQVTASASNAVNTPILDSPGAAVSDTITVAASGISQIEFVEVTFTSDHTDAGDLEIILSRPGGTTSRLAETRTCLTIAGATVSCGTGYSAGWRFGISRHLGESADGDWTLSVQDKAGGDTGTFQSWSITIYGR